MMAKNSQTSERRRAMSRTDDKGMPVSKQTAGGITGAVLGGIVAGPVGAIAGGVAGAMVGDASAKGKKPVKRAVETIRTEVTTGRTRKAIASVASGLTSSRKKKGVTKKKTTKVVSKKAKSKPTTKKIEARVNREDDSRAQG